MKSRHPGKLGLRDSCLLLVFLLGVRAGFSQTKYLLPLGDSVTWGKSDNAPPSAPGEHGYRDHLYNLLHTLYSIDFTGTDDDGNYDGIWMDMATIDEYLPGAAYDIVPMLDGLANKPDFVTFHMGTNDIGSEQPVGRYDDDLADGTIIGELSTMIRTLLNWNGGSIEQIFLCKIIPASPYNEEPPRNTKTMDYNTKIDQWYETLSSYDKDRVTLVNMFTPFYANQYTYYNVDYDPLTLDDHIHPNPTGYSAMADYFADYIIDYMAVPLVDHFDRTDRDLNGDNGWTATVDGADQTIRIDNITTAIYSTDTTSWGNLAIWNNSYGLNSVSMRIHPSSTTNADTLSGIGILFGMTSTDVATAHGYMAFVRNNSVSVWSIASRQIVGSSPVASASMRNTVPGDTLHLTYAAVSGNNSVYLSLNSGQEVFLSLNVDNLVTGTKYYSGVIFRDSCNTRLLADFFQAQRHFIDPYPPAQIDDLMAVSSTSSTVTLSWSAVGDNGDEPGIAASYDLRYSTSAITESNFNQANIVPGVPPPNSRGSNETFTVKGLFSGTRYYFAIKAIDRYGNPGLISAPLYKATTTEGQVIDDLTSLNGWKYDPTEYGIDATYGELRNIKTSTSPYAWGTMAIYKVRANPTVARMVWGHAVINPTTNVTENGGLIVLADDSSVTANGYFVFVRTRSKLIYLYDVQSGVPISQLDAVAYNYQALGRYPSASDTLTVVLDKSESSYIKFDVYLNNKQASQYSLFDTRPEYERHGSADKSYAGILLARLSGIRDNNVGAFVSSAERTGAAAIAAVGTSVFSGTVGKWLQDSTNVCRVVVRDENYTPLSNIPVYFQETAGGGEVNVSYTTDGNIRLEAEWGNPVPPMIQLSDPAASGGAYIVSTQRGGDTRGYTTYQFYIETPGTYFFWGRVKGASYYNRWVYQFELVGKTPVDGFAWWVLYDEWKTGKLTNSQMMTTWNWDMIQEEDGPQPFSADLTTGVYTIRIVTAHENILLDKILITRDEAYIPEGTETVPTLLTDANGEAAVAWKLGTVADSLGTPANEGLNRVIARTYLTEESVNFTATALADIPVSMVKKNDNQSGMAGDTLSLNVNLTDTYGNPTPNRRVSFQVIQGDGWLVHPADTTDNGGEAAALLVLGAQDSLFRVRATFTGYTGPDVIFTAVATAGLANQIVNQTPSATFYVGQILPNFLKVKVLSDLGSPVAGIPVRFSVTEGDGHAGKLPKWTNASGIAQDTLYLGDAAGMIRVIAQITKLTQTAVYDSVFYRGVLVKYLSGSGNILALNGLSVNPLRVVILDSNNQPVSGQPVSFVINNTASGFRFENGSTVFIDTTDSDGVTKRAKVRAGSIHGSFVDLVQASATDGFFSIPDSPIGFTFHVKSDAHHFVKVQGDNLEGNVHSIVGPLKVQLLKSNGQSVGGQPVTFRRILGNGSFDPSISLPQKQIIGDVNGFALVYFWLGSEAGQYNNQVVAYTINVDDSISVVFQLSARSSNADTILALTSTSLTNVVGKPQTVRIKITDEDGNAVSGVSTVFTITAGNGILNGTAVQTVTSSTNVSGVATVTWILGTVAGTLNNTLEATASNGLINLKGSPVVFRASANPDVASTSTSQLDANTPVPAIPDSICHISVRLKDAFGNAVPGKRVGIHVKGSIWDVWQRETAPSDAQGVATSFLQSPTAGEKIIKAVVDGDTLEDYARVIFLANNATRLEYYSGGNDTANVGTVLQEPFVVRVTDGFNSVPYGPVYFIVLGDKGDIVEPMPVVSDSLGLAQAHLKLDTQPGVHYVMVSSPGLTGSPSFTAIGKIGVPVSMGYPNDGYDWDLEGVAGESLPQPFIAKVTDEGGLPVYGENVTFQIQTQGSNASVIDSQPVTTDEYGLAKVYVKVDTRSGFETWVTANHASIPWPVWFSALSVSGPAQKILAVSETEQSAVVNEDVVLEVQVTDTYGNPRSNVPVQFEVQEGNASIVGNPVVKTNALGKASVTITIGTTTGMVGVWAMSQALEGSPVEFIINVETNIQMAADIIRFPNLGDAQIRGTVNQFLVDSLRVRVIDEYGNGVPGQTVIFRKLSGEGWIVNDLGELVSSERVDNHENGTAAVAFKMGSTSGTGTQVVAEWRSGKKVTFTILTVTNPHNPVLDKSYIFNTYNIEEGEYPPLRIFMVGSDLDPSQTLTFEIADAFPPAGAAVVSQSDTSAMFQWSPDYDQDGTYDITLRVQDGWGRSDQKTVKIYVQNINRLPSIVGTVPEEDTTMAVGQTVRFWVDARDPDGDPLTYSWKINGVFVAGNQALYDYDVPKSTTPGNHIVDVFVSDGLFTISHRWTLSLTTSVEMAEFGAAYVIEKSCVRIWWATSREVDNAGFEVVRASARDGEYLKLDEQSITASAEGLYEFMDNTVEVGRTYYYKVVDIDIRGNRVEHGPLMVRIPLPEKFDLAQNYPNPFNPVTTIRFQVAKRERVRLTVFNLIGQSVADLVDEVKNPGYYTVDWDGKDQAGREAPTGIYIYRLAGEKETLIRRMVKIR